ncbi:copper resistance CopC family protein [Tuberibacillus calidus]|uniref:copper resistance CopC family protein n=1 Tax=Tuberibacillus calidus TaxID=340097 RepID=UPI000403D869|nr:copper resistance CopC family protein [Tuberibacillus calidus]
MKKFVAILCLFLLIPNMASAHAELVDSQPKQGETVKQAVDALTLDFSEEVKAFKNFSLTDENGKAVPAVTPSVSGKKVTVNLQKPLADGNYIAKWEIVAADGHQSKGQLTFTVGEEKQQTPSPKKTPIEKPIEKTDHTTLYTGAAILLGIIIIVAFLALLKKKD